jgi:glycine hydroxymethyltransferase
MAEGLFRELVKERPDYTVQSAGVAAYGDLPPSQHTQAILSERGVDTTLMHSQLLTEEVVSSASHIFCMSRSHLHAVSRAFPQAADRCYLVTEFTAEDRLRNQDIADPFGGSRRDYNKVRDALDESLPSLIAYMDATHRPAESTP